MLCHSRHCRQPTPWRHCCRPFRKRHEVRLCADLWIAPYEGQTASEYTPNFPQIGCRRPAKPFQHAVCDVMSQDGGRNTNGVVGRSLREGAASRSVHGISESRSPRPAAVADGFTWMPKPLVSGQVVRPATRGLHREQEFGIIAPPPLIVVIAAGFEARKRLF